MQDPSCPDIAGRVLEGLGHCGIRADHPAVPPAIAFIRKQQDPCGAWWGRWGVNYVYGTWQVLTGLRAVGEDMNKPLRPARRRLAAKRPETRRQLRRNVPELRRIHPSRAKAPAPHRKPPGARWA